MPCRSAWLERSERVPWKRFDKAGDRVDCRFCAEELTFLEDIYIHLTESTKESNLIEFAVHMKKQYDYAIIRKYVDRKSLRLY